MKYLADEGIRFLHRGSGNTGFQQCRPQIPEPPPRQLDCFLSHISLILDATTSLPLMREMRTTLIFLVKALACRWCTHESAGTATKVSGTHVFTYVLMHSNELIKKDIIAFTMVAMLIRRNTDSCL